MLVGNPARDGEAEACSLRVVRGVSAAVESLEHVRQLVRPDPDPGITDEYFAAAILGGNVQANAPGRRRELDGVVQDNQ